MGAEEWQRHYVMFQMMDVFAEFEQCRRSGILFLCSLVRRQSLRDFREWGRDPE
jgi:hypothetical protein